VFSVTPWVSWWGGGGGFSKDVVFSLDWAGAKWGGSGRGEWVRRVSEGE